MGLSTLPGFHAFSLKNDDVLPFGYDRDLTKSERYNINAEKALTAKPNIRLVVGHSPVGSVAFELQKALPRLTVQNIRRASS